MNEGGIHLCGFSRGSDVNERLKAKIEQVKLSLIDSGIIEENVLGSSETGPGDYKSYFEYMIDRRLDGKAQPTPEELWKEMRLQINHLSRALSRASEDYRKMENRCRALQNDLNEIIKEK